MEGNELVALTKEILANKDIIARDIDKYLAEYKDYADTLSDLIGPAKTLSSLLTLARKMRLKGFLTSYAKHLEENGVADDKKLKDYFAKRYNVETVAEIVDCAINGRSILCASLLGILAGKCLAEGNRLSHVDAALAYALRSMQDADLYNFVVLVLCDQCQVFPRYIPQIPFDGAGACGGEESLNMTLQKLISLQIFLPVSPTRGLSYKTTAHAKALLSLVERSGVIPEEHLTAIVDTVIKHRPPSSTDKFIKEMLYFARTNRNRK